MLLGQKIRTPDREQGFISCIYADGLIDVDILAHDAKHPSDTTTFGYYKKDVAICVDQTPQLGDITPLGRVRLLEILTDGIIHVGFFYKNDETFTLWLSDARVECYPTGYALPYANWVVDILPLLKHGGFLALIVSLYNLNGFSCFRRSCL